MGGIFAPTTGQNGHRAPANSRRVVATHVYEDTEGKPAYRVCRTDPKGFFQQRYAGGTWQNGMAGVDRIPYRLPEVIAADLVVVVEGEKDVDRAYASGLIDLLSEQTGLKVAATCNAQGAGKWGAGWGVKYFAGKQVVILPDNDEPGQQHARQVVADLTGHAQAVAALNLPGLPPKGDLSDWLDSGRTAPEVAALIVAALEHPEREQQSRPSASAFSLADALDTGEYTPPHEEAIVERVLLARSVTILNGPPKVFKTCVATYLAACISKGEPFYGLATRQARVLYVAADVDHARMQRQLDVIDPFWRQRKQISLPILEKLPAKRLRLPMDGEILADLLRASRASVLVLDTFRRVVQDGLDPDKNKDISMFMGWLVAFAQQHGVAILLINHTNKGGRRVSGAGAFESDCQIEVLLNRVREKDAPRRQFLWLRPGVTRVREFEPIFLIPPVPREDDDGHAPPAAPLQELGAVGRVAIVNPYDDDGEGQQGTLAGKALELLKERPGHWFFTRQVAEALDVADNHARKELGKLLSAGLIERQGGATTPAQWRAPALAPSEIGVRGAGIESLRINTRTSHPQITECEQVDKRAAVAQREGSCLRHRATGRIWRIARVTLEEVHLIADDTGEPWPGGAIELAALSQFDVLEVQHEQPAAAQS
ncbi:RecA-family ATPase [Gloeobacter kilaueensis JS1]|uniref:RecA-family ATPase n=2 Tax=Gloeobacter TaxID=33071 RepID=U5QCM7_GLOK1|nr:RecA-family ATPase [Gloeobacter kilaueensis JS1]